jgi:DNA-binding NarL/FixJ family response regulator
VSDPKLTMKSFFENQVCLVVDPSKSFQASIQQCLKGLGQPSLNIVLIAKYEDAQRRIDELKPRIIITEYEVDGQKGLSLVEQQQKYHEDQSRISVVISRNSSDSAVAEAAEEQIDCFILKPFSMDEFRKKLTAVIENKINPSPYSLKIKEGRKVLQTKDYETAKALFQEAKTLHSKPSLACFYLGDSYRAISQMPAALAEFKEGRSYNNLHYKCLIGEFEVFVETKDYHKANALIPILIENFPLTPKRLTQVFIASVFSKQFDHLPVYYEQLVRFDKRSPELTKIASVALFTGGKWFLQKNDLKHACSLFEKALTAAVRDSVLLEQIVMELRKVGATKEADHFAAKSKYHMPK